MILNLVSRNVGCVALYKTVLVGIMFPKLTETTPVCLTCLIVHMFSLGTLSSIKNALIKFYDAIRNLRVRISQFNLFRCGSDFLFCKIIKVRSLFGGAPGEVSLVRMGFKKSMGDRQSLIMK